ncbi:AAA family ATPase [Plantactinospora sp. B6F1]|uniref:AAA family ATPase n=1 Tax=Plantactinospora sp. B6F1 TaxID=3158971 RepID=UPI0032D9063B
MEKQLIGVEVENFRSLRKVSLPLGPLNVLVGPNGAGKTNVLEVFRFLADVIRTDLQPALDLRGGFDELVFRGGEEQPAHIQIKLRANWTPHSSRDAPDRYSLRVSHLRRGLSRRESFEFNRSQGRGRRITLHGQKVSVVDAGRGGGEQELGISAMSSGLSTLPRLTDIRGGKEVSALARRISSSRGLVRPAFLHDPSDRFDHAYPAAHPDELEVHRGDVEHFESLRKGYHSGIDVTERCCDELPHQLGCSTAILVSRIHDGVAVPTAGNRIEELQFQRGAVARVVSEEVARLAKDRFRDEKLSGPLCQQPEAGGMVLVTSVEACDQRAGIAKQLSHALRRTESIASTISRSRRASAMISRYRADSSCSPMFTSPTHGKRRRIGP